MGPIWKDHCSGVLSFALDLEKGTFEHEEMVSDPESTLAYDEVDGVEGVDIPDDADS